MSKLLIFNYEHYQFSTTNTKKSVPLKSVVEANTMPIREMTIDEKIIRQSIDVYQATIDDLCRRRNELAAMLPANATKNKMSTVGVGGYEIKLWGGKRIEKKTNDILGR